MTKKFFSATRHYRLGSHSWYWPLQATSTISLDPPPPKKKTAMEKYSKESLEARLNLPWSIPLATSFFLLSKKDDKLRPCIDFGGLNELTVKNPLNHRNQCISYLHPVQWALLPGKSRHWCAVHSQKSLIQLRPTSQAICSTYRTLPCAALAPHSAL